MYSALKDVLQGTEENYLLPFYWQHGDHTEQIPAQMERIYNSGCRAVCVESRPHKDFCGDGWWRDMDIILAEAQKRDMKVWILDDDHFPTGHANGQIAKKYPHLRPWVLIERHLDVVGPMPEASVLLPAEDDEHILLGAYAYRRYADDEEICEYEAVDLTDKVQNGYLIWDISTGVWRIFFYYRSREGGKKDYIDMLDPASVDVLIEAVYQPHWEHYKTHFGKTLAGFFSDEPGFKNDYQGRRRADMGTYEARVGRVGLSLPWNEQVRKRMKHTLGFDPLPHLNLLWYEGDGNGEARAKLRFAYMDAITAMYQENFCMRLGNWCRSHGVEYIGHVIEDNGCHARLRMGAGHYFRSLDGQDMAGMDIVLHQVMPGMSDYTHSSTLSSGVANGTFFHYTLGKLCASLAHLTPAMKHRAMCEVFGAYGWAEGTPLMKWLIDFLLVRGINHFVPHAFSPKYPDPDCPPHFGAEGHDPSFEGFCELMKYTNRASHLLCGGKHLANAALLYHAEAEWANKIDTSMPVDLPLKELLDNHIDCDIIPFDYLQNATVSNRKLCISDESFDCLIIPTAPHLPQDFYPTLKRLQAEGLPVWFIERLPDNADTCFDTIPLHSLANRMKQNRMTDVTVPDGFEKLRIYHTVKDEHNVFMLFNEDYAKTAKTTLTLPVSGAYVKANVLETSYTSGNTANGSVEINLCPGESVFLIFGSEAEFPAEKKTARTEILHPTYELALANADTLDQFEACGTYQSFFNVASHSFRPGFSGKMKYTFRFSANTAKQVLLDLGHVGENAVLYINGQNCGTRICPPYRFDITNAVQNGENLAEITVSNTLALQIRDKFSLNMQIPPAGILGDLTLINCE
ncbi:MAG: glycosyl transferase family 2 [Clostridia bacterium]|nr:glycosyl transferase family 2 [Clostridia bacterium]